MRAAGAVAGVMLEAHLQQVAGKHGVKLRMKSPTISDLNDALKAAETIEVPTWRFIQRLGDLRNFATHKKEAEPTKDQMTELIDGVGKILQTLF